MLDRRRSKCLELESLPIFLPERQGWGMAESRCNGHARLRQMGGSKWPQILLTLKERPIEAPPAEVLHWRAGAAGRRRTCRVSAASSSRAHASYDRSTHRVG